MSSTLNTQAVNLLNMETLAERLRDALDKAKMTQAELSRRIGTSRATVSLWLSGATKEIGSGNLLETASALGVNPQWLATGHGQRERSIPSLDGGDILVWESPEDLPADPSRVWVDRWDYACSAGTGLLQWEVRQKNALPFTSDFFRAIGSKPENCKLLMARGRSMEPYLFDKDMIMVDVSKVQISDGQIYAVCLEYESLVKQVFKEQGGALVLHSFNREWQDKRIEPTHEGQFSIIGEVVYRSGAGLAGR